MIVVRSVFGMSSTASSSLPGMSSLKLAENISTSTWFLYNVDMRKHRPQYWLPSRQKLQTSYRVDKKLQLPQWNYFMTLSQMQVWKLLFSHSQFALLGFLLTMLIVISYHNHDIHVCRHTISIKSLQEDMTMLWFFSPAQKSKIDLS